MKHMLVIMAFLVSGLATAETAEDVGSRIIFTSNLNSKMRLAKKHYGEAKYKKSYKQFNELARLGLKEAQFMAGMMLIKGRGQSKDMVHGISWLYVASEAKAKWVVQADKYFSTLTRPEKRQVQTMVTKYIELFGMDSQLVSCRRESVAGTHFKKVICTKQRNVRTPLFSEAGILIANVTIERTPSTNGVTGASAALPGVRAPSSR